MLTTQAVSAHGAPADCPTAFPTTSAVDGVTGTGYTVERGTTPAPFTATVLGRITDGIAPGIDMIMADLSSPALTRAGGVWAGMSGSPVYAADGRLIGSVSYGLASSSPIAGITPAEDMQTLLSAPVAAKATHSKIKVTAEVAARIAKTGDASKAAASDGFVRLKVPVSVSGASKFAPKFLKDLTKNSGLIVHAGGAASAKKAVSSPSEITAGSNFAAALSYGDVTIAGVGTTTFVCHGEAVAFGHPLLAAGDVQYTAHPATSVYIQPDPVWGPFKVANPGSPVGVVSLDKLTGIRTTLGAAPTTAFPVTTSLEVGSAETTGTTTGVYQPFAADIAALHLQANIVKALGQDGGGSAALTFTITGRTAAGTPWSLVRSDHYSDPDWISYAAADDLYSAISSIVYQDFKDVTITGVAITGSVSPVVQQYHISGVQMQVKGKWVTQKGAIVTKPGANLSRRLLLTKYRSDATITRVLTLKVPARTSGDEGELVISNGLEADVPGDEPASFTALLRSLAAAPTNDSIAAQLELDGVKQVNVLTTRRLDAVVSDYYRTLDVRVK